jgi:signal transduction histidine kinase
VYFGLLLLLSFGVAGVLTAYFLNMALDRLVYSNVNGLNETIAESLQGSSLEDLSSKIATVQQVTGVETIVLANGIVEYTSFPEEQPNLDTAWRVSNDFQVYQIRFQEKTFFFTIENIPESHYQILILRAEVAYPGSDRVYYAAFVGIVFLILAVSTVSFITTRQFTRPIRELAEYAGRLSPENSPERRPDFTTEEFNELGSALENTAIRLHEYHETEQEFLHNFSHEMKTPLTNIYGYAEAMHYNVLSEEEGKTASLVIMNESEKLKNTIEQILLLGRLESKQNAFAFQKNNLVDVINDAMDGVGIEAKEAGIELRFRNSEEDHYLICDAEKMETVFKNLLSNGIRYAKSGVSLTIQDSPDRMIIHVDDDGPGIPEEETKKVFERFYTGFKGHTGLGLTIAQSIVEHHQGTITAGRSPENGARFTLRFPKKGTEEENPIEKRKTR